MFKHVWARRECNRRWFPCRMDVNQTGLSCQVPACSYIKASSSIDHRFHVFMPIRIHLSILLYSTKCRTFLSSLFFPPVFSCVAVHFFFIPHELRYCSSFFIRPLPTGWPIHSCGVRHLFTIHYVLTVVRYSIVISQLSGGGIDLVWGKKNAMNEYQPLSHFLHLFHL